MSLIQSDDAESSAQASPVGEERLQLPPYIQSSYRSTTHHVDSIISSKAQDLKEFIKFTLQQQQNVGGSATVSPGLTPAKPTPLLTTHHTTHHTIGSSGDGQVSHGNNQLTTTLLNFEAAPEQIPENKEIRPSPDRAQKIEQASNSTPCFLRPLLYSTSNRLATAESPAKNLGNQFEMPGLYPVNQYQNAAMYRSLK